MLEVLIDEEFQRQLIPLTPFEFGFLELSIIKEGLREPLIVWRGSGADVLIDGHNRHAICTRAGLPYTVSPMEFENREAVEEWIDKNQCGRRNLSSDDFRIVSGRIYNRRKKAVGSVNQHTAGGQFGPQQKTAEIVAEELGTSPRVLKRNGQRAELHDTLMSAGEDEAAEAVKHVPQSVISDARKLPVAEAAAVAKSAHVSNNSGENEWYTPVEYIDAARDVMGGIDLDPATSEIANKRVQASAWYSKADDGLQQNWSGRVWLNPPYAQPLIRQFAEKIVESISGDVTAAIVLVNNATETGWFYMMADKASAVCFPERRIRFLDPEGNPGAPLQGQAFLYFGDSSTEFCERFSEFGWCAIVTKGNT
jgi:phage N-6-adenine-methyltransferase